MAIDRHAMGDKHEAWLAETFGGRRTRGSGNQWRDPIDGRQNHREVEFAFAWDGKSTMAQSITIDRPMLRKAKEQAGPERPMIGVRFYDDERLRSFEDWVLIKAEDLNEIVERASGE